MKGKMAGSKNPMFGRKMSDKAKQNIIRSRMDKTIYTFRNIITNEIFNGNRIDFRKHVNVGRDFIYLLVKRKSHSCKGWVLST